MERERAQKKETRRILQKSIKMGDKMECEKKEDIWGREESGIICFRGRIECVQHRSGMPKKPTYGN